MKQQITVWPDEESWNPPCGGNQKRTNRLPGVETESRLDMSDSIKSQLSAAIGARKDSLKALRARIVDIVEPIPVGVKLRDDNGTVIAIVEQVVTGASQWSNRKWQVNIKGWALVDPLHQVIAECLDDSIFDGRNVHYRSTEATCLNDGQTRLRFASGKCTREIAAMLPAAIARYIEECEAERKANACTLD